MDRSYINGVDVLPLRNAVPRYHNGKAGQSAKMSVEFSKAKEGARRRTRKHSDNFEKNDGDNSRKKVGTATPANPRLKQGAIKERHQLHVGRASISKNPAPILGSKP